MVFLEGSQAGGRHDYHRHRTSETGKKERWRRESPVGTPGFDPMAHNPHISPYGFCAELLDSWSSSLSESQTAANARGYLATALPVADVPGLYILGEVMKKYQHLDTQIGPTLQEILELEGISKRFHAHELRSGARYAEFIHERYGQKLILAPTLYESSTPGFDGIILDRTGRIIENFSLKTAETANHPVNAAIKAVDGANQFSFLEDWLVALELLRLRPKLELTDFARFPARKRQAIILRAERIFRLFGLSSRLHPGKVRRPRPTRIFIDMQDHERMVIEARTWRDLQQRVNHSNGVVGGIVVAHDDTFVVVERTGITRYELTSLVTGSLAPGPESEDP